MILFAFEGSIQLVPDGTILFHLGLVVAMVLLLNATLLRPINRILEDRERRTKGRMAEARTVLDRVSEQLRDYENRMREARANGYLILEGVRGEASKDRDKRVAEVGAEVSVWLDEQKRRLAKDETEAKISLGQASQERALEIGRQILARPIGSSKA